MEGERTQSYSTIMLLRQTKSSCPLRSSLGSLYTSPRLLTDHVGGKDLLTIMWWGQKGCKAQKRNVTWGSPCPLLGTWSTHTLRALPHRDPNPLPAPRHRDTLISASSWCHQEGPGKVWAEAGRQGGNWIILRALESVSRNQNNVLKERTCCFH